ncbi:MAG TPA: SDR family NAD(P)-dependent oxidoreductase [Chloroflexota bacterium]|nr:SDR family NAD(P)-dependent oxidoreductase [Chloroflexota bacterium]
MSLPLADRVAVVTGASRGVGKGIALGLGEAGATVYVTGRTIEEGTAPWPGTIGATAEAVSALGGRGVAVRCDHHDDAAIAALFTQVQAEHGRLDVLVNNVYSIPGLETPGDVPFWELPFEVWDHIHTVGLRAHFVASRAAAPLMIAQGRGLIVNVSSVGGARYLFNVAYGAAKAALERLAADMAHELRPYGVAALSIRPSMVATERTRATAHLWTNRPTPEPAQSPRFAGRAVAALTADPAVMAKTGQALEVADLAAEYGFVDPGD